MKIELRYLSYDALRAENPGKFRVVISKIELASQVGDRSRGQRSNLMILPSAQAQPGWPGIIRAMSNSF